MIRINYVLDLGARNCTSRQKYPAKNCTCKFLKPHKNATTIVKFDYIIDLRDFEEEIRGLLIKK